MSLRINCPECDTVFEPPGDVWSARCPFCAHEVEVPHTHGELNAATFRKRLRKQPGWLIRLRSHLPAWANPVLILSFSLLMLSFTLQAWMATHADRSATAMLRAIKAYQAVATTTDTDELIKSCDRLIAQWGPESANQVAAQAGLKLASIRHQRLNLVRNRWSAALHRQAGQNTQAALVAIATLIDQAKADQDLVELVPKGLSQWQKERSLAIGNSIERCRANIQSRNAAQAAEELINAEAFWLARLTEVTVPEEFDTTLTNLATQLARWRGIRFDVQMTSTTFTAAEQARQLTEPVAARAWKGKGYIAPRFKSDRLARAFQDSSTFRLSQRIAERYGRGFEETPHRTTILEVQLTLYQNNREVWSQQSTSRTPRIPARTAMGMSRLQLSKQSDEKIEKKLNEAAWESLPASLSQPLQLLEDAVRLAPGPSEI